MTDCGTKSVSSVTPSKAPAQMRVTPSGMENDDSLRPAG